MSGKSTYEDDILRSLRRITRAIDLHSRQLAAQYGLTGPQLICLRVLADQGPMSPSKLAKEVSLSQGTITGIVDRLFARQLVARERSTSDRRSVVLTATPLGEEMIHKAPSPLQERFAESLRKLPDENQLVIHTILEQIVRMMDAEQMDAAPLLSSGPHTAAANQVSQFLDQPPENVTPLTPKNESAPDAARQESQSKKGVS